MSMQEVAVKPHVVVVLQSDVKHLEEVVVTAMGISREKGHWDMLFRKLALRN